MTEITNKKWINVSEITDAELQLDCDSEGFVQWNLLIKMAGCEVTLCELKTEDLQKLQTCLDSKKRWIKS